jgi:hypothetical protein
VDLLEEFEKKIKKRWLTGWLVGAAGLTQHPQTHNVPPKTPGTVFQPFDPR